MSTPQNSSNASPNDSHIANHNANSSTDTSTITSTSSTTSTSTSSPSTSSTSASASSASSPPTSSTPTTSHDATPSTTPQEALQMFDQVLSRLLLNSIVEVMEALETLLVYTKNLILYPDEKKYRKIKITNIHYQERLGHLNGAQEAMHSIGYVPQGEYLRLDETRMAHKDNAAALKQLEAAITQQLGELKKKWAVLPERTHQTHVFTSVTAAGSYNCIGKRNNMEDDEIMVDKFCDDPKQGYFGLYDGHGGRATVDFVVKALHMNLEQHMKRNPSDPFSEAFKQSYLATDGQLRRQNILRSGTTSVTCVIRDDVKENKKLLFTANVGDSRAVLCRGNKAVRLTIDHKASLPEEAKRIIDAGGFIGRNKRVNGVLAISRALGDHMLKERDVVSAEPFCSTTDITPDDTYILLACDGVWDVMTDQEAIDFMLQKIKVFEKEVGEEKRAKASARDDGKQQEENVDATATPALTQQDLNEVLNRTSQALVNEALERRSLDNVTVMIIQI